MRENNLPKDTLDEDVGMKTDDTNKIEDVENEYKKEDVNDDKEGVVKRESKDEGEKMPGRTCLSCSKCSQPLGWAEQERYVSRIG